MVSVAEALAGLTLYSDAVHFDSFWRGVLFEQSECGPPAFGLGDLFLMVKRHTGLPRERVLHCLEAGRVEVGKAHRAAWDVEAHLAGWRLAAAGAGCKGAPLEEQEMFNRIRYCSRLEAEAMPAFDDTVVISITSPGERPAALAEGFREVLRLAFHDVTGPCRWGDQVLLPIAPGQAEEIVEFLARWHRAQERLRLLVHCEAGISRSAAVARFASERYRIPVEDVQPECPYANSEVLRRLRQASGDRPATDD